jgi:general secretion pathway protein H
VRGFTLIEVLVVTVILAVLAATVSLTLAGSGGERQLEREAQRLSALIGYACERAELTGRSIGVAFAQGGYVFTERQLDAWMPLKDGELRQRKWMAGLAAQLSRDGVAAQIAEALPDQPQLACFPSGELTPFRIELALADRGGGGWRIDGEPDGKLTLERRNASR